MCVKWVSSGGEGEGVRVGFEQEGKERGAGKGVAVICVFVKLEIFS